MTPPTPRVEPSAADDALFGRMMSQLQAGSHTREGLEKTNSKDRLLVTADQVGLGFRV